jgi:hypothetical protein
VQIGSDLPRDDREVFGRDPTGGVSRQIVEPPFQLSQYVLVRRFVLASRGDRGKRTSLPRRIGEPAGGIQGQGERRTAPPRQGAQDLRRSEILGETPEVQSESGKVKKARPVLRSDCRRKSIGFEVVPDA